MYVGDEFTAIDVGEVLVLTLDFARSLDTGETIVSSYWLCTVAADSLTDDPSPQDHISLDADVVGTLSKQQVAGLLGGVKYVLQAFVVTNQGNTKSLWTHVACEVPA